MTNKTKPKFKVGDKVRITEGGYGFHYCDIGKVVTVTNHSVAFETFRYGTTTEGLAGTYHTQISANESCLELAEAAPVSESTKPLMIEYGGIKIEFDPSNPKCSIIVNGMLKAIYEDAQQ